jgi:hypothetical protein
LFGRGIDGGGGLKSALENDAKQIGRTQKFGVSTTFCVKQSVHHVVVVVSF